MKRIYLDYAATTPAHPEVLAAMQPYFSQRFGNASSMHSFGQEAKAAVERAREQVAALIGARPEEIVFTSGGTESNNFAVHGAVKADSHIITSAIEHHAVLEPCKLYKNVTILPVDKHGLVDPDELRKALTDKTVLVSIMHANNEIGTIEPIEEIGKVLKGKGIVFHTDAVQTVGGIEVDVNKLGVDLLSLSGHKFYGPKGIGALYIRKGTKMKSFLLGGGQERHRRASTENVPGIVGLGVAAELAIKEMEMRNEKLLKLRNKLIEGIKKNIPDVILNGHPEKRLPKNVDVTVKYVEGESMLLNLDMQGIAVSTGSACSSGSLEPSHVMIAIGHSPETAHGSIRFTLGRLTATNDIDRVLDVFPKIVKKLRAMSPLAKGGD